MINFRIIARIFSLLLIVEGLFMLISSAVSYIYQEEAAYSFFYSALITLVTGIIAFTPVKDAARVTGKKEGYIIITGGWILYTLFGTLPFLLSDTTRSFTDAFFESMAGFTTTAATIFPDVENLPHGILFWRSLTQWIGAMGIIFISLYILPVFRSVYIQLPAADFSGQQTDKIHPRIKDAAKRLIMIFAVLTLLEAIMLAISGVDVFDAVCLSFSTMSTGGFTTMNNSISESVGPLTMIILTIFMFIAGMSMSYLYFAYKKEFVKVYHNREFIFYVTVCFIFAVANSVIFWLNSGFSFREAMTEGSFHAISIITTTGFYVNDHLFWGDLVMIIFFIMMLTGGTSGSPSGGIKSIRLLLVTRNSRQELSRLLHPNAFMPVKIDKRIINQTIIFNVLVFTSLYFLIVSLSSFLVSLMGYDMITSFSTSVTMLANIGPGFGEDGMFNNYSDASDAAKWFFSSLMLLGRLELLTVMVLFTRSFYTR